MVLQEGGRRDDPRQVLNLNLRSNIHVPVKRNTGLKEKKIFFKYIYLFAKVNRRYI